MSTDPKPSPPHHPWGTLQVVGVGMTLTGLAPDRWMTAFLDAVKLPDTLSAGVDVRFIAVDVDVAVTAADAFLRHRRRPQQSFAIQPVAPVSAALPTPACQASATVLSRPCNQLPRS